MKEYLVSVLWSDKSWNEPGDSDTQNLSVRLCFCLSFCWMPTSSNLVVCFHLLLVKSIKQTVTWCKRCYPPHYQVIQNDCFFITLQQWWGPLNLLLASTSSLSSQWGRQQRDVRDAISLSLSPAQVEVESRGGKQKLLAKKDPKIPLPPLAYPMWVEWVEQLSKNWFTMEWVLDRSS